MRVLLIGNYGVGNLGDEALKDFFLKEFPEVDWIVIDKEHRLPAGIRSFFRFRWMHTLKEYLRCDAVVFGGGSLFTDAESLWACVLWWIHFLPAWVLGIPVHLAFQGVGPFRTRAGEWLTRMVLCNAASISVRDSASKIRAEYLCKSKKIVQSSDPVILLIEKEKVDIRTENLLILIPRKNSTENFSKTAQKYAMSRGWSAIHILSLEPNNPSEKIFVKSLAKRLGAMATCHSIQTLSELLWHIASARQVISERYHGALPALMYGKPVEIIHQRPGDKLSELSHETFSVDSVKEGIEHLRTSLALQ